MKDLIDKLDEKLLGLLLGDKESKEEFFIKVKDVFVLKQNELKFFIDENKLDNSYTQYQNEIGLRVGNKLLSERDEVVLDWPFKDCVLEGGMTKEDQKRNEIFFNEVLAKDEIDRLEDPKTLVNWRRYTAKAKDGEKVKELKRDKDGTIRENLIIKGNNLLALHSLKEQFSGKIKLVYIDPPYNTGTDGFKYNDSFNHSSWLVFMKNRLEVAKQLLKNDGVIFVQCDYNEAHYIKVLMDEVFGKDKFINEIVWKRKFGNANETKRLGTAYDNIFIFAKTENYQITLIKEKDSRHVQEYIKSRFTKKDNSGKHKGQLWMPYPLANPGNPTKNLMYEYKGYKSPEKGWRMVKGKLAELDNDDRLYFPGDKSQRIQEKKFLDEYEGQPVDSLWTDIFVINSQSGEAYDFDGQKPEDLIKRILLISTESRDIVLDYHLGSGTTCAVAHKMGRQYIGIEQMDYIKNVTCKRLKKVIAGDESGISKIVNWKGGGDFVYVELAKWNEEAKEKILMAKSLNELARLFDELYERYFLNYNVKTKEFKEKTLKEERFKKLSLNAQKKLFVEMLDMNQMYVNFSERADKKYNLSKEDIALSEEFYNAKK